MSFLGCEMQKDLFRDLLINNFQYFKRSPLRTSKESIFSIEMEKIIITLGIFQVILLTYQKIKQVLIHPIMMRNFLLDQQHSFLDQRYLNTLLQLKKHF